MGDINTVDPDVDNTTLILPGPKFPLRITIKVDNTLKSYLLSSV